MQDPTILCLAGLEKGHDFLRAMAALSWRVILLTRDDLTDAKWPRESIEEIHTLPTLTSTHDLLDFVSRLTRRRRIDRVVGLDDFDITTAAQVREHLGMPGMSYSTARRWKDKLAMRIAADQASVRVPSFIGFFNDRAITKYLQEIPGPWMLKPRAFAGSIGMRRIDTAREVTDAFDRLGASSADYLLERFIPGDVFHVDGVVAGGRVRFAQAHRYGEPPLKTAHEGGVFTTATLDRQLGVNRDLLETHERVVAALRLENGVTHAEFIVDPGGDVYFLEAACRVGGAHIADLVEHSTGLNLWREWARLESSSPDAPYEPPATKPRHAGVALCLSRDPWPDLSAYEFPERVWTLEKLHHAGLIVAHEDPRRVEELLAECRRRFAEDFLAVLPPRDRPDV